MNYIACKGCQGTGRQRVPHTPSFLVFTERVCPVCKGRGVIPEPGSAQEQALRGALSSTSEPPPVPAELQHLVNLGGSAPEDGKGPASTTDKWVAQTSHSSPDNLHILRTLTNQLNRATDELNVVSRAVDCLKFSADKLSQRLSELEANDARRENEIKTLRDYIYSLKISKGS